MDNEYLQNKLEAYGADLYGIEERFMGDGELYLMCLRQTLADKNFDLLGQALDNEDHNKAFECAHTLKGVIANMGLTPLLTDVCVLVEALRSGQYDDNDQQYHQVLKSREKANGLLK